MILRFKDKSLNLHSPKVMGVLNLTPDSFYDGGKLKSDVNILKKVEQHLLEGASIIDLGAYSTRPGADNINILEEKKRLLSIIPLVLKEYPETLISVDTFRKKVAQDAIELGAFMVNDISGGSLDSEMFPYIGENNIPYVLMHLRGTPQTMTSLTTYGDLIKDIKSDIKNKTKLLTSLGGDQIIIDLGYGFAKTVDQNFKLLKNAKTFTDLGLPILTGVSRKSMIYKTLNSSPEKALNGTTVLNTVALLNGSKLLRVHDVKEAVEVVKLTQELISV